MLLAGRFLAISAGLVVQVLIVRYLSQSAYGAFAYGLAVANLLTVAVGLGLEQAVQRFAAMYDEQGRPDRLAGALILHLLTVGVLGAVVVVTTWMVSDDLAGGLIADRQAASLLVVLSLLAPLQALDGLVMNLFAVYARPTAIFWRRYVLAPGLKLLVAAFVVLLGAPVAALAWGYVVATVVGLAIYGPLLVRLLTQRGVLRTGQRVRLPFRELYSFTLRALSADLLVIVLFASDVIIVGALGGSEDVALLQAVQPLATGNLLVFYAMIPLFIPQATRLFARGDRSGLGQAYGRGTLWIAVFTFPVLALTGPVAAPITVVLFGSAYANAAPVLLFLALGQYVLAVFGLSGLTCKAVGQLGLLAWVNGGVAVLNIAVNLALVPRFGPVGAAAGTFGSLVLLSVLKIRVLRRATGLRTLEAELCRGLLTVSIAAAVLYVLVRAADLGVLVSMALAAVLSLGVVRANRDALGMGAVFPELVQSWPGRLLGLR